MSHNETQRWTMHDVSEFIAGHTESDTPDRVLQVLKGEHGKQITTRLTAKMPGGSDRWRLRRQYGMTHLENVEYLSDDHSDQNGVSLLLGHFEDARELDATTIEGLNPAYFSGRYARNHLRMEARNTRGVLEDAARLINRLQVARAALVTAEAEIDALTECGQPLSPDKYALQRALGWRQG